MSQKSTVGQRTGGTWQAAPCVTFTLLIIAAITACPLSAAEAAGDSPSRFSRYARRVIQAASISEFEAQQQHETVCACAAGFDPEEWQCEEEAARLAFCMDSAGALPEPPALAVSVIRGP